MVKNPPANADVGSIPGLGRCPGEKNSNPLQYSCLGNPTDQRSLMGYSPWGDRVKHNLVMKQHALQGPMRKRLSSSSSREAEFALQSQV